MRILDLRPGHHDADLRAARRTIREEIGHPSKTVMILRGRGAEISLFADRAATRSDSIPWREVLWVKEPEEILTQSQKRWFGDDEVIIAVVLDFFDRPAASLESNASLFDIEMAFLRAQTQQEEDA